MDSKECSVCKLTLNLSRFEGEGKRLRNQCKSCRLKQIQESRHKRKVVDKVVPPTKSCKYCNTSKSSDQFNRSSTSIDGLSQKCRECYKKTRYRKSSTKEPPQTGISMLYCGKCNLQKSVSEFRAYKRAKTGYFSTCNSCWKPREWNKEKQKLSERKYVSKNPEKIKAKNIRQGKMPHRIIKQRISARIKCALNSASTYKNNKTVHYIGCEMVYFRRWLEYQFVEGMSWGNRSEWHIDHVKPCASFNLSDEEEQKICFNWRNMRPCWKTENMEKGDKIDTELIARHEDTVKRFLEVNPLPTQPGDRVGGAE
jgi:hypothetical protein